MKRNFKYISTIIVVAIMGYIFFLSSQSGKVSNEFSYKIMIKLRDYIQSSKWIGDSFKNIFLSNPELVTRKLAHLAIYFILGLGVYLIIPKKWSLKKCIAVSIGICTLYGVTDEIHQMIVPNRTPQVMDVIIDTIGSSIGIGVGMVFNKLYMKYIGKEGENKSG